MHTVKELSAHDQAHTLGGRDSFGTDAGQFVGNLFGFWDAHSGKLSALNRIVPGAGTAMAVAAGLFAATN